MESKGRLYQWAAEKVQSPRATLWLVIFFLLEVVLFVPLDALLALYCLERPQKKYLFAVLAAIASTCTAVLGYYIGAYLWTAFSPFLLKYVISPSFFAHMQSHYLQYESWAVFIGAFLPVPFKAVTVSAGACEVPFILFLLAVFMGRSIRFFALSKAMGRWADPIRRFLRNSLPKVCVAIGIKIVLTFAFFWILGHG